MQQLMYQLCLITVLAPLFGSIIAGIFGKQIGKKAAHSITIAGVATSFVAACYIAKAMFVTKVVPSSMEFTWYYWGIIGDLRLQVGFLLDSLTVLMMLVVSFVSLMVHIYTMGYMQDDPGYQRFFSYISLFTFAMLMLVMANNFLQLFFGWEAVGLVSYLLIGFWFKKPSAIFANMKAFIVNRFGDFGFLLGIGAILYTFGSLDYNIVFNNAPAIMAKQQVFAIIPGMYWNVFTVICILLFIGAMGKSAQVPLHVWLPDSMEGPTPISALIHAATMVTAGVFLVARMSPLFEYSQTALNFVLIIGSITCLFMGLIGTVQKDIKRIIAYSTLSQLGYMVMALGVSAYSVAIFHLMTHAFFKALLFLGAGSCIIAMHHEQDIFKMGGLRKYMPITYLTMLIGSLAIIGFPFFSGFYSKESIIEAIKYSQLPAAKFSYIVALATVFITAFYSFRLFFLVFHTQERMDLETKSHLKESPLSVTLPLILLAIPSVIAGFWFMPKLVSGFLNDSIFVLDSHVSLAKITEHFDGVVNFAFHGFTSLPFMLAMGGVLTALLSYVFMPKIANIGKVILYPLYKILDNKYWFDAVYQFIFASGTKILGLFCWKVSDKFLIDDLLVNGSANAVGKISSKVRTLQTGYIYHYVFAMVAGLVVFLLWLIFH